MSSIIYHITVLIHFFYLLYVLLKIVMIQPYIKQVVKKMKNITLSEIYRYMNNVVDQKKVETLTLITIERCIYLLVGEISLHNESFNCRCFKCRVWRVLLSVLVQRKIYKLLLLIHVSNYNSISEETIYDNVIIWR